MTQIEKAIKPKLGLLELARQLGTWPLAASASPARVWAFSLAKKALHAASDSDCDTIRGSCMCRLSLRFLRSAKN